MFEPTTRIVLAGLLAAASPLAAQSVRVSGRLTDATTDRPVAGAVLELSAIVASAVTDGAGTFTFPTVPPGRYRLRIRHLGYGTHQDSLTVMAGDVVLAIRISPRAIELEPLRVDAAAREPTGTSRAYVVTRAQIEEMVGRARHIGDVVRAHIPGASVYETPAGYVCLEFRGARGARTRGCNFPLVVVDDVPILAPAQFLRDTPPEDIERIEFVPASAGAGRYGLDSQYGALVIATRRSGVGAERPGQAAAEPAVPPAYPSYAWEREPQDHPWQRTIAASAAGNVLGVATGLAALGCFSSGGGGMDCVAGRSVGAGLAALALPLAGTTFGANLFGATELSRGRAAYAIAAAAIPTLIGYAMVRDGATAGFATSRLIGGALVFVGAPLAATIADGLFRRAREPEL